MVVWSFERVKKFLERVTDFFGRKFIEVVAEFFFRENFCVVGVKAKDQARAKFAERIAEGGLALVIIFVEGFANGFDNFCGLVGNFFFGRSVVGVRVD